MSDAPGGAVTRPAGEDRVGLRGERGPILLAMMLATAIVATDSTILSTTVPTIVGDLGGFQSYPWLFSIYLLALAVTVPVYSKIADTFGRKPVMLLGIAIFFTASLFAGFAWSMPSLVAFRALQGLGAGAIQPISMTILGDIYSPVERGKVQGYIASVWAAASVVGPSLGAVFSTLDAWRWIFLINIPICLVAAWLVRSRYHERLERHRHHIDLWGAATVTSALGFLILGVLEGGNAWEWSSLESIGVFLIGAACLIAFGLIERRAIEPVLPLHLLHRRVIVVSCVIGVAQGATLMGLTAFVPTYLETGASVSAFVGSAAVAAVVLGWPVAAMFVGRLYVRWGYRRPTIIGTALILAATTALAVFASNPNPWLIGVCGFVVGWGFGWSAVPALISAQSAVAWHERGVTTGMVMFSRSLGQALGVAILGAVSNAVIAARGGDQTDPATIVAAGAAVFMGVFAIAALHFAVSLWMPKRVDTVSPGPSVGAGTATAE